MSWSGLICHVVGYTVPRLRWLGWRQGIWQLLSIVFEAVCCYESVFERRKERDEYILKHGRREWTEGCEIPTSLEGLICLAQTSDETLRELEARILEGQIISVYGFWANVPIIGESKQGTEEDVHGH